MSLLSAISNIQSQIIFDPKIYGIPAVYTRRVENEDGDNTEVLSCNLFISPQGNFSTTDSRDNEIGARINVVWAKSEDLVFDTEPFLPEPGDKITYTIDGKKQIFCVGSQQRSNMRQNMRINAVFDYEDAENKMIKIMTFKVE